MREPTVLLCPFRASVMHPESEALARRAVAWTIDQQLLIGPTERAIEKIRSYSLLAASCYPTAPFERLAAINDYYSWLFFIDDACEDLSLEGASPQRISGFLRGSYGPLMGDEPADHGRRLSRFTDALADIWGRIAPASPPPWRARLTRHVASYIDACVWEAQNRRLDRVPSRQVFQAMRMFTSTMYEFWDFIEYAGGFYLPDDVVEHPVLAELRRAANAVASFANDIFSLRKELASRDFHNLVVVLQHEESLDPRTALARAVELHDAQVRHYCALERAVPSFGPAHDDHVARYLEGMRTWMRANHDWSTTTPRYNDLAIAIASEAPAPAPRAVVPPIPRRARSSPRRSRPDRPPYLTSNLLFWPPKPSGA